MYSFDLQQILKVIESAIAHLNRFVREIAYFVVNAIFVASAGVKETEHWNTFIAFSEQIIPLIVFGLGDNWSQVRYASSLCARSFYESLSGDEVLMDKFNPQLVPCMCLNRYYVAEGVRVYSIETWKRIFGDNGK